MDENTNKEPEIILVEKYKDIPDDQFVPLESGIDNAFLGKYEINKLGHIKNIKLGKITKDVKNTVGRNYPIISFRNQYIKKNYFIHRLVALTFLQNPENKPDVDHINRDKNNYKLSNLRWATRSENARNKDSGSIERTKYFRGINPVTDETIIIYYKDLDTPEIGRISSAVRSGSRLYGFIWERGDSAVDNYISRVGFPKDEDWKECPYLSGIFCNKVGLLKVKGILTVGHNQKGYREITINRKTYSLHRLIYETFNGKIEDDSLVIDHINTVKDDNRLENLRLVTQSENMNNPTTLKKLLKPVKQFDLNGKFIKEYRGISFAVEDMKLLRGKEFDRKDLNCHDNTIQLCCDKKTRTGYGFLWCWSGDEGKIQEDLEHFNNCSISKYDKDKKFIKTYKSLRKASEDSMKSDGRKVNWSTIAKYIDTGTLCTDDCYYYHGSPETIGDI